MEVLGPAVLILMISQTIIQLTALEQHCLLGMLATTLFFSRNTDDHVIYIQVYERDQFTGLLNTNMSTKMKHQE